MDNNIDRATMEGGREIRYRDALNIDSRLSVGGDFSFPFNSEFNSVFPISPATAAGVNKAKGIYLFPNTASEAFLPIKTILENYDSSSDDDWSVVLTIASGAFNGTVAYDSTDNLYDATGSSQTQYRIPIVRSEVFVATYGAYAEKTVCINGESVVQFIHI